MTTKPLLEEQKEIVRQFFQGFSAGDIPGVLSLFRDDASYWLATTRETLDLGRLADGLKFVQSRLKGPIRYEIGTMVAEPNKIVAQVDGFGATVEGAAYNNLYHIYFELDSDKIVRAREYNDTAHVFDTLRKGERRWAGAARNIAKVTSSRHHYRDGTRMISVRGSIPEHCIYLADVAGAGATSL